jgi:hypothetical protein
MAKQLICPLMSMQFKNMGEAPEFCECQERECAFWSVIIIEKKHRPDEKKEGCAIKLLAEKK